MKELDIFTMDYLFENGFNEDGDKVVETSVIVVAEDAEGRRFALNDSDLTTVMMSLEEIWDIQKRRIDKITVHLDKGGALNLAHWNEIDPAYGSEAYDKLDRTGYFKELEIRAENESF